ncbi:uncharacterized protein FMAN_14537 [Fusarium mangiferae]|uniref:Uncharacterized protein n=1 Tax=Fusarium mangiferae TaxID=192010 RepID=A0A1L7UAB9_FUSMA|nr:uncharacterized protein FMAN_14537 [Fusarium mangiferae]CVL07660.1 uncharacterized protein FMAN_14537 [Fusarium mangiferae]
MSDRTKMSSGEETNPPHAQLSIAASPSLDFKPKIDFKVPSRWMVAVLVHSTSTWLTAQGRQNEARYALIKGEAPPEGSKFFQVASIPVSKLGDVETRIRSVLLEENPEGETQFNRQYVRDVLKNLVDGGIIREDRARDALLAVEAFAELQSKAT